LTQTDPIAIYFSSTHVVGVLDDDQRSVGFVEIGIFPDPVSQFVETESAIFVVFYQGSLHSGDLCGAA
jgi:hypothetical protein